MKQMINNRIQAAKLEKSLNIVTELSAHIHISRYQISKLPNYKFIKYLRLL